MEAESDSFLKTLQNRSRNFTKKLERAKKKQVEVKNSGKDLKEEERKLIESAPLVEELLQENEKVIEQYKKHLESLQKEEKKPAVKVEEDRSMEVVSLWALVEFLANQQIKEKLIRENPSEQQDLEAFLLLNSQAKGQSGKKLSEICSELEKSIEFYLAKSEKVAPGTMKTYKKLAEIGSRFHQWACSQQRPATPVKVELKVESVPVLNAVQVVEKNEIVEEVKQEVKVRNEVVVAPVEVKVVEPEQLPPSSKWALEDDEEEEEVKKEADEGFTTVTGRKKNTHNRGQEPERSQRGRGGRRSGRRGRDRGH